jgi:carbonic anhydrase/acetyltransferase-like protein (isoleucine patch superfamily)
MSIKQKDKDMKKLENKVKIHSTAFIAPNATIIGDVTIEENVSVWYGAIVRGDIASIKIGKNSNVQDGCVIHVDEGYPTIIGSNVTMGHHAIVHGAIIEDTVIIGIKSAVLSGAKVGSFSIIGAGAIVTEGTVIPPYSLVLGIPGKVVKQLSEEQIKRVVENSKHYVELKEVHKLYVEELGKK